jgi:hypothetical protein
MKAAKRRAVKIGRLRSKGLELKAETHQRAQGLSRVIEGLSGLSARKAAEELKCHERTNAERWQVARDNSYSCPL